MKEFYCLEDLAKELGKLLTTIDLSSAESIVETGVPLHRYCLENTIKLKSYSNNSISGNYFGIKFQFNFLFQNSELIGALEYFTKQRIIFIF